MSRDRKALIRSERIKQLQRQKFDCYQVQDNSKMPKREDEANEKMTLWNFLKKVWLVLTNKADTHGNMTSGSFAMLVSVVFRAVALAGFLFLTVGMYTTVLYAIQLPWQGWLAVIKNIYVLTMMAMILFILGMYSLIMWGASNEMRKEKDKNYIVSVFSGVVSFAALIVALVALVKG
jgi:hypothetical protein